jgi:hypothetical protein
LQEYVRLPSLSNEADKGDDMKFKHLALPGIMTLFLLCSCGDKITNPPVSSGISTDRGGSNLETTSLPGFDKIYFEINPADHTVCVHFVATKGKLVTLDIFNAVGARIKTLTNDAGHSSVTWDGTDYNNDPVTSGIYFLRLTSGTYSMTRKLILLK